MADNKNPGPAGPTSGMLQKPEQGFEEAAAQFTATARKHVTFHQQRADLAINALGKAADRHGAVGKIREQADAKYNAAEQLRQEADTLHSQANGQRDEVSEILRTAHTSLAEPGRSPST